MNPTPLEIKSNQTAKLFLNNEATFHKLIPIGMFLRFRNLEFRILFYWRMCIKLRMHSLKQQCSNWNIALLLLLLLPTTVSAAAGTVDFFLPSSSGSQFSTPFASFVDIFSFSVVLRPRCMSNAHCSSSFSVLFIIYVYK